MDLKTKELAGARDTGLRRRAAAEVRSEAASGKLIF
jgi:hypothetical protein